MCDVIYIQSEKTNKKYTIGQAVEMAKNVLQSKRGHAHTALCTTAVKSRNRTEKITLVELNQLIESMVNDSTYFAI